MMPQQKKAIVRLIFPLFLVMVLYCGPNLFSKEIKTDTISVDKTEFETGEEITINYRCSQENIKNLWIGIFESNISTMMMKEAGLSIKIQGELNGSITLNATGGHGPYQVRMFSRKSGGVTIHQRLNIAVLPPKGDTLHPPTGLTVYLGGAGMDGTYIDDQVRVFRGKPYKMNAVAGKFTDGSEIDVAMICAFVDRQKNEDILRHYDQVAEGVRDIKKWLRRDDAKACKYIPPGRYEVDWSLKGIGINQPIPSRGQFNFIGYSWGSLIAAQSAIYHADKGIKVNHLVLIGSPISKSFLEELKNHKNIGKVIIRDLTQYGDPIYAGMPIRELMLNIGTIILQWHGGVKRGKGHFYYAPEDKRGQKRRAELAADLYKEGLR